MVTKEDHDELIRKVAGYNKQLNLKHKIMKPEEKAKELIHQYRVLLMNEGEDYGEEILVSVLSEKMALIAVQEMIDELECIEQLNELPIVYSDFYKEVKQEIMKL